MDETLFHIPIVCILVNIHTHHWISQDDLGSQSHNGKEDLEDFQGSYPVAFPPPSLHFYNYTYYTYDYQHISYQTNHP